MLILSLNISYNLDWNQLLSHYYTNKSFHIPLVDEMLGHQGNVCPLLSSYVVIPIEFVS